MTSSFWKTKKVLITGHTGFKGSWLAAWLYQLGARVTGYSLPPPSGKSLFEDAGIGHLVNNIFGDIRDRWHLHDAVATVKPDVVFHLAAQALVRPSYKDPVETYAANVMGTVHLLEAVRHQPAVRAVVNVTSDKCYENRGQPQGFREDAPMGGYDPYSSSKGCAELVTAAYRQSFFNPVQYADHGVAIASARAGNVIGPGDWAEDRLIPDVIRAFSAGRPVAVRNPAATRPWQHVLDAVAGYLILAEKLWVEGPAYGEGWNFGPSEQDVRPVQWIVEEAVRLWGKGASFRVESAPQPHEAPCLMLDCAKAHRHLGWYSRLRLEEAIAWTVAGYRQCETTHAQAMMRQQILEYSRRIPS